MNFFETNFVKLLRNVMMPHPAMFSLLSIQFYFPLFQFFFILFFVCFWIFFFLFSFSKFLFFFVYNIIFYESIYVFVVIYYIYFTLLTRIWMLYIHYTYIYSTPHQMYIWIFIRTNSIMKKNCFYSYVHMSKNKKNPYHCK